MVRRYPGHDTQGQPADPAQPNDSLPLHSSGEGEIALFTIPGSVRDGKVRDVRHAERLRFPDLDLTSSADLQALSASLTNGETAGSDLPLQVETVPDTAPADQLELTAGDPGLEWFDDEAERAAAATRSEPVLNEVRARLLTFGRSAASRRRRMLAESRGKARRSWSSATKVSARVAASARKAASAMPMDEVMRGALFTAAMVAIVVVLARFDWTRPVELPAAPVGVQGTSTSPLQALSTTEAPPRALAGQPLGPFGRLAPSLEDEDLSTGEVPETRTPEPVETLAADVRRDTSVEADGGEPVEPAAVRSEAALPVQAARRDPIASLVAIDDAPPRPIADAIPRPSIVDAVPAGGIPAETADAVLAPAGPPAEAEAIVAALSQLEVAYERRDANLARAIWPTVDARALARAFDGLRSQSVEFDGCRVTVEGATGEVHCQGTTTYVPRVGSQYARTETREWVFRLEKGDERWVITRAAAR